MFWYCVGECLQSNKHKTSKPPPNKNTTNRQPSIFPKCTSDLGCTSCKLKVRQVKHLGETTATYASHTEYCCISTQPHSTSQYYSAKCHSSFSLPPQPQSCGSAFTVPTQDTKNSTHPTAKHPTVAPSTSLTATKQHPPNNSNIRIWRSIAAPQRVQPFLARSCLGLAVASVNCS